MYQTKLMSLNSINRGEEWSCIRRPCYPSIQTNAWKWQRLCLHSSRPLWHFINDTSGQGCIDSPIVNFHCVPLTSENQTGVRVLVDTHPAIPICGWLQAMMIFVRWFTCCERTLIFEWVRHWFYAFFCVISTWPSLKLWWAIINRVSIYDLWVTL